MSYIQLEFESGFNINNNLTDTNLYIINGTLNRQYTNLYGNCNLSLAIPMHNLQARNEILNNIKRGKKIKIYQYSDQLYSKNKKLLLNGYISNVSIQGSTINIIIGDTTMLLAESHIKPGYNFNSRNFIAVLTNILNAHGFINLIDGIIYPTRKNILIGNSANIVAGDKETIASYLQRLCNDLKIYITTIYINNKSYLYCLDTLEVLQAKYNAIDIDLDITKNTSNIIDYEMNIDYSKISDIITVNNRANILNGELANISTYSRGGISLNTYTENKISESDAPPILFTTQIKSNINGFNMRDYATYLFKKQIQSAVRITVKLPGLYPDLSNPSQEWNIGTLVNIKNDPNNLIYNDLKVNFYDVLQGTFGNDFIVAGFEMNFDQQNQSTTIEIVPSSFIKG